MQLGAFSISLNVADLARSQTFYETLGFATLGGDADQGWLMLRNGDCTLGLFQGHIKANALTFNPGWSQNAEALDSFDDIRQIAARLQAAGIAITTQPASGTGPAQFTCTDPDGNEILLDQHVSAPKEP